MNAAALAQSAYSAPTTPTRTDRGIEYEVFARVTRNISKAIAAGGGGFAQLVGSLHQNRQLWMVLAADVANDANTLPEQLRAQIFYLAEFTDIQTRKVLSGTAGAEALVEINTAIMRGLREAGRVTP